MSGTEWSTVSLEELERSRYPHVKQNQYFLLESLRESRTYLQASLGVIPYLYSLNHLYLLNSLRISDRGKESVCAWRGEQERWRDREDGKEGIEGVGMR